MLIVIDIPDRIYKRQGYLNIIDSEILRNALKDGIPLPKEHGRLIDASSISFSQFFDAGDYLQAVRGIYDAPTIIEADREVEE